MTELTVGEEAPGFPEELHHTMLELAGDNADLREDLERVRAQFLALTHEGPGWMPWIGGSMDANTGLDLDTLKTIAETLREEVAGSALPKKANEARYSYTFGKPFHYDGIDATKNGTRARGKARGRKSDLQNFYDSDSAKRHVFSEEAQQRMHSASSTDSCYLLVGNDDTKEVNAVSIVQIDGVILNPDFSDDIWAYQRSWKRQVTLPDGRQDTENMREWVYTDRYTGVRPKKINDVPVAQNKTIIDISFSNQVGWTFGVPDLMAGQIWNRKYLTMISYGEAVTETLAYYAAKVKANSQQGASNVGLKIGQGQGRAGNTIAYGAGNEVDVFSTAGKTYDFGGLRIFAAFYAAAVGLPLTDLTADPSAAGASYGSAAALMPGARRLIETRRGLWAAWYQRVIKWATGKTVYVEPASIMEEDEYRSAQKIVMAFDSGEFHHDEIRPALARVAGIELLHEGPPEGVMYPNNTESWERADIDPKEDPNGSVSAASPDQGKSNGTGGASDSSKKDMRRDTISAENAAMKLTIVEQSERMERIEEMLQHLTNSVVQ